MRNLIVQLTMLTATLFFIGAATKPSLPLWANDFEKVDIGNEPDDTLIMSGEFTVRKLEDNHVLMLPGAPLETMMILLGPAKSQGVSITAKIHSERTARRLPSFGVGLCGAQGLKLVVSPMKDTLELLEDTTSIARTEYKWQAGKWTHLRLAIMPESNNSWLVRGKVWSEGTDEPVSWSLNHTLDHAPPNGAASLLGLPYSSKPIYYDEVVYEEVSRQP